MLTARMIQVMIANYLLMVRQSVGKPVRFQA